MTATFHLITAGNGYTYLTKSVAAADMDRGRQGLGDYYSVHGESPGRWYGRGLAGLQVFEGIPATVTVGAKVSEAHMRALFGEGLHPDADLVQKAMIARGIPENQIWQAIRLGRMFPDVINKTPGSGFVQTLQAAYRQWREDNDTSQIPADVRARLRTEIATKLFTDQYGFAPERRELQAFIARESRGNPQPVAGYDITFSAPKSVSILWAISDIRTSTRLHELHQQAVKECLDWFQDEMLFTRRGAGGVRQVKTRGAMIAMFDHRDSRAGDPDLHTHCAISNKVQAEDGTWLSIDGREIFSGMVALSERYNTRIQELISQEWGVNWVKVAHGDRRPTFEVEGVPLELIDGFSSRRRSIIAVQARLTAAFEADHGRPPTSTEAHDLAQQATLMTRPGKKTGLSFHEQRDQWGPQAAQLVGQRRFRKVASLLVKAGRRARWRFNPASLDDDLQPYLADFKAASARGLTAALAAVVANKVIQQVSGERATFNSYNLIAETQRQIRGVIRPGAIQEAVTRIVADAQKRCVNLASPDLVGVAELPAELVVDGHSVYRRYHADLYTTQAILDAERRIVQAGGDRTGMVMQQVDLAIAFTRAEADGLRLNASQRALVTAMATSGCRVQLALAPAGAGKTTAMQVLADAWRSVGGNVVGLSHQAVAAEQLRAAIGENALCDTINSLTFCLERGFQIPQWARQVNEKTLLIVDEAGIASTKDLDTLITWAASKGASIRLIGDDRQLAAIGAGGVLRDLAATHGVVTLDELMRFRRSDGSIDEAESAASLALRNGNHDALAHYADCGRIHAVADTTAAQMIVADWQADIRAGRSSLMLAQRVDDVRELNELARNWRIKTGQVNNRHVVELHDGLFAGVGDIIVTRLNRRRLRTSRTDFVKNRDRWIVRNVHSDGSLDVINQSSRRRIRLPGDYVHEHVELGYAVTIAAAEGLTVDSGRTLYRGQENREDSYVAATRGRFENHLYVCVAGDSDPETAVFDEQDRLLSAVQVLEKILDNSSQADSATTIRRLASDPFTTIGTDTHIYMDALASYGYTLLGVDGVTQLTAAADQMAQQRGYTKALSGEPAWQALLNRLVTLAANQVNPLPVLAAAMDQRRLEDDRENPARDDAAVLCWRLEDAIRLPAGPLPWLPGVPAALLQSRSVGAMAPAQTQQWRTVLTAYSHRIKASADEIRTQATTWTSQNAPAWAHPFTDAPALVAEAAVWRASHQVRENDLRPLGDSSAVGLDPRQQHHYRQMTESFKRVSDVARWEPDVHTSRVLDDPGWLVTATRCTQAVRAGRIDEDQLHQAIRHYTDPFTYEDHLPIEQPAAALWWRLARHLKPIPQAIPTRSETSLRPAWTSPILTNAGWRADELVADPAWNQLLNQGRDIPPAILTTVITDAVQAAQQAGVPVADWARYITADLPRLVEQYTTTPDQDIPEPDNDPDYPALRGPDPEDETWYLAQLAHQEHPAAAPAIDTGPSAEDEQWYLNQLESSIPAAYTTSTEPVADSIETTVPDPHVVPPADIDQLGGTPAGRIIALNQQAANYFKSLYENSWAAPYMRGRFGDDLADDPRWSLGYAPSSWHSLIDYLTQNSNATADELVDAGLAAWSHDGRRRLHDVFADRLMIAIRDPYGEIIGFAGRANPNAKPRPDGTPIPKYVNTPGTQVFTKGATVFGADLLKPGQTPVLVEGQLDVIAVTLAGADTAIGLAPGGTSLTERQVELIARLTPQRTIIVATDQDDAGWEAAKKDYSLLTAAAFNPVRLPIIDAKDPAEMRQNNPDLLAMYLAHPDLLPNLASQLVHRHMDDTLAWQRQTNPDANLDDVLNGVWWLHTRWAADIIAQLPPDTDYAQICLQAGDAFTDQPAGTDNKWGERIAARVLHQLGVEKQWLPCDYQNIPSEHLPGLTALKLRGQQPWPWPDDLPIEWDEAQQDWNETPDDEPFTHRPNITVNTPGPRLSL